VAIAIRLGLVQRLSRDNPEHARTLAGELSNELQDTIAALRDLAHGIFPPLLHERGLGEALIAAAHRSPVAITVKCTGDLRYPSEVETAVYFVCLEAIQNSTKHADAQSVAVFLTHDRGLRFSVSDDGRGFDTNAPSSGQGLVSMSDRIGAIGGTLGIRSVLGRGTTVAGFVPIAD
jgi:signal transduction histidine kinase